MTRHWILPATGALLPAFLAAGLAAFTTIPAWPLILLVGISAAGIAAHTARTGTAPQNRHRHNVDDGFVEAELVDGIPVTTEAMTVRITMPLTAKTYATGAFLCSLPPTTQVTLCLTGVWEPYTTDTRWRGDLVKLEKAMRQHYEHDVVILATRWQSAMMTFEEMREDDTGVTAYILPLEATGQHWLYVDISNAPFIRNKCRTMTDNIVGDMGSPRTLEQLLNASEVDDAPEG